MRNGTHLPNGAEVRRLRVRHGWNQEDLASKVGVGKRTIERIEGGYPTTIKVLKFVAEALNVEVESILMVSAVPYPHVTKNILKGKRHFGHLMQVILAAFVVLLMRELALVLLFWVYALGLPLNYVAHRQLRRKAAVTPRLEEGLPR